MLGFNEPPGNPSENFADAMQNLAGAFKPPAKHREQIHSRGKQWNSQQQHAHVAQKNYYDGKEIALFRDVTLASFQNMPSQRHMKCVSRADQQMEPDGELCPVPDKMANREDKYEQRHVNRKKVRCERD